MQLASSTAESDFSTPLGGPSSGGVESVELEESSQAIQTHVLGVKPLGNLYTASRNAKDMTGVFQVLPDELLAICLDYCDSLQLCLLGSTCKFFYAFCRSDDLWKTLFIGSQESQSGNFIWQSSWRSTYLGLRESRSSNIDCCDVYSDVLYRPFLCTHTSLVPYTTSIPHSNAIARFEDLDPEEFSKNWNNKPFILTKPVREWPVHRSWDSSTLLEKYRDIRFRAEAVDWTLQTYVDYMNNSSDESPLYLFDRGFVQKMDLQIGKTKPSPSYWIPDCFGEDLFAVLGEQRPDDRWLIVGPARSGSTFHKDPNATSAWNAVLRGSKYWIMFPSNLTTPPPPGVYVSEDQSEVTSPLSIAEWLLGFHAEARRTPGCAEGVCGEGEVLHVPSGWWHLVVNLEPAIAITQNFVPRSHLAGVLSFLRDKPDQVSGFKKDVIDPYGIFVERMKTEHPDLLDQALNELDTKSESKKRKWDAAVGHGDLEPGGFTFGFGDDSDEDVP